MSTLVEQLALYATYHRDPRNIVTHCVGIPLIILGLDILLSDFTLFTLVIPISIALLANVLLGCYYLRSHLSFGVTVSVWLLVLEAIAHNFAASISNAWMTGIVLLLTGWILQFVGHYYEGKKPAFFDDVRGLLIGPGFIVLEIHTRLGFFKQLAHSVESCNRVGTTRP